MNQFGAFLRLIRYPNLFFIALTQVLFYYFIIIPSKEQYSDANVNLSPMLLIWMVAASVLIAAGGYIINDYFDLYIDRVNRPGRIVIEKKIKRRWAIVWHLGFSFLGVVISFYLGWKLGNLLIGFFNMAAVFLLWSYSTTFKKKLLIGNVIISLLTAWVVLVLYVAELRNPLRLSGDQARFVHDVFKLAVLYGSFAFIISLIREVVKDMEDMEGDEKYRCKTIPIVWGLPAAKMFVSIWIMVLSAAIIILEVYALQLQWWWMVVYLFFLVLIPLYLIFRKLMPALVSADFSKISRMIKLVMFTGILSMMFFKLYS